MAPTGLLSGPYSYAEFGLPLTDGQLGREGYMPADGSKVISEILEAALPRPEATASIANKIQYAVRFADRAATCIARDLSPTLRGIYATPKRTAGSIRGQKQLDINFSTPQHGLLVGISLKSVHL